MASDEDEEDSLEFIDYNKVSHCRCFLCKQLDQLNHISTDKVSEQGVDPNLRDGDGATPLHFAASRGHVDTVRWLLRHGARLTLDKFGKSPINDAAENQQMECLNILVQHGTTPDYQDDEVNGKLHGCTCRKGDPNEKCSYADCVNYASPRAPFYLHPPSSRTESPPHDGLYVNPMASHDSGSVSSGESFYLHNPHQLVYNRVKDLFETPAGNAPSTRRISSDTSPINPLTVKVEVHSSSSGAGSEENLSSSDLSERSGDHEHDYEDIYHLKDSRHGSVGGHNLLAGHGNGGGSTGKSVRSRSRDSGSHSRSGSISSTNSGGIIVTLGPHGNPPLQSQDQPSMTPSTESGVSSASPSDMGHSEEENEKAPPMKSTHRHSLPHSGHPRQLKRVVSEPSGMCPPPPPPPPLPTSAHHDLSRKSSSSTDDGIDRKEEGTLKSGGGDDSSEAETLLAASPLNKQLVLPFIPPKFPSSGENCLIKPSEFLKSIGGTRPQSVASSVNGTLVHKDFNKCLEKKLNELGGGEEGDAPPPPPPMPGTLDLSEYAESADPSSPNSTKARKLAQPLSTISIHDLNSVQLRRTDKTVVHRTMSSPVKPQVPGGVVEPFQAQKQDLIAELKMSRDIEGVKKMKVERLKTEEKQEKEFVNEIAKQVNANTLMDKIPEKDATGNPIPPWKRQMLAKKAAEKARKDLEDQMKREAEEKRLQAIPAWKRQLLAKKEDTDSKSPLYTPKIMEEKKPQVLGKIGEMNGHCNGESNPEINNNKENSRPREKSQERSGDPEDDGPIMPWRAQLRKTNSKLSLLE